MNLTFGDHLRQFVHAVDVVDNDIKDSILESIERYLEAELGVKFFTLLVETITESQSGTKARGLRATEWLRGGDSGIFPLRDGAGNYQGQVSLAFDQNLCLWIVSDPGGGELQNSESYADLWPKISSEKIPKYLTKNDYSILTSIIMPLRSDKFDPSFGVINFESERYLKYSQAVREELDKVASSISKLYERNRAYSKQRSDTKRAIHHLNDIKSSNLPSVISQRRVFLASPNKSEDDVIGVIIDVLDKYDIEVVFWKNLSETGVINLRILSEIKSCQYGICYLSEKLDSQAISQGDLRRYKDNPNVLIEAGILSAKSVSFENVIPIREQDSDKIPFDIAANRILMVPRIKDGRLNESTFTNNLSAMLNSWFKTA